MTVGKSKLDRPAFSVWLPASAAFALVGATMLLASNVTGVAHTAAQATATCIAIVAPSVRGFEGNSADVGSLVRDLFASYLTGPSTQVVRLQARLASQAMEEAKQQNCAHVLMATLQGKRGGGMVGKVMGQAAGTAAWYIPGGGTVKSAVARGVAISTAQAVATIASSTRAKDEMRLEYRVSSPAGAVEVGPTNEKLKATVDGEDLLTPLVEKASESILATILK